MYRRLVKQSQSRRAEDPQTLITRTCTRGTPADLSARTCTLLTSRTKSAAVINVGRMVFGGWIPRTTAESCAERAATGIDVKPRRRLTDTRTTHSGRVRPNGSRLSCGA